MTNSDFLAIIKNSFKIYLEKHTSTSTAKLNPLHGKIAKELQNKLGEEFVIKSKGYKEGKEDKIQGRYYTKDVDITVEYKNKIVAGYAIKFVMRNYSQNSNNYFENMLGETANIRSNSIPYFHIFIIFSKVPYYDKDGKFKKYDNISGHNIDKYVKLSKDNPDCYKHTPDKTLLCIIDLKEKSKNYKFKDQKEYDDYYLRVINSSDLLKYSDITDKFDNSVIVNNFEDYINRTICIIKGKLKS